MKMEIRQIIAIPQSQSADISFHLYEIKTYYSVFWIVTEVITKSEKDRILVRETALTYFDNKEKAIQYIGLKRKHSYLKTQSAEALPYGSLE